MLWILNLNFPINLWRCGWCGDSFLKPVCDLYSGCLSSSLQATSLLSLLPRISHHWGFCNRMRYAMKWLPLIIYMLGPLATGPLALCTAAYSLLQIYSFLCKHLPIRHYFRSGHQPVLSYILQQLWYASGWVPFSLNQPQKKEDGQWYSLKLSRRKKCWWLWQQRPDKTFVITP